MKKIAILVASAMLFAPLSNAIYAQNNGETLASNDIFASGIASFYANKFNGKRTASGELFNNSELTAAHRSLAFGTKIRITNKANGRQTIFRINDRGPWSNGRIIDISRAAAQEIGMIQRGVAHVDLEIIK